MRQAVMTAFGLAIGNFLYQAMRGHQWGHALTPEQVAEIGRFHQHTGEHGWRGAR